MGALDRIGTGTAVVAALALVAVLVIGLLARRLHRQGAEIHRLAGELVTAREREHAVRQRYEFVGERLTWIAHQADGAVTALRTGRPGRAVEPVEAIAATARHTLSEGHTTLGGSPDRLRDEPPGLVVDRPDHPHLPSPDRPAPAR